MPGFDIFAKIKENITETGDRELAISSLLGDIQAGKKTQLNLNNFLTFLQTSNKPIRKTHPDLFSKLNSRGPDAGI